MPTATTASIFRARHIATRMGTKGMYSSAIPMVDEPTANSPTMPPTSNTGRPPRRPIAAPIAASMAPVPFTTPMTPPTMKTKKMMSAASAIPFGMRVSAACHGRAAASVRRYDPSTTLRPGTRRTASSPSTTGGAPGAGTRVSPAAGVSTSSRS